MRNRKKVMDCRLTGRETTRTDVPTQPFRESGIGAVCFRRKGTIC